MGALALGVCPVVNGADSAALDRVEVSGPHAALRVDVQRACPNLTEDLARGLAQSISNVGRDADYQVRFDLRDGAISSIQTLGGPQDYRRSVRSAMYRVDCKDEVAQGQVQRFAFLLSIRNEDSVGPKSARFAVRELTPAMLASTH
jgi:hypothetical protein